MKPFLSCPVVALTDSVVLLFSFFSFSALLSCSFDLILCLYLYSDLALSYTYPCVYQVYERVIYLDSSIFCSVCVCVCVCLCLGRSSFP
ncbi:hypothetical protein BDV29DRAFT_18833 [Aspergillus leporis]|uniref:Uncharacterized protein n=1 Tax=Aspergillus leporis TaxID=41062 RepID=A0A5N5WSN3_9EURO|nr:hypothetical protein BDV29DRAFT_18833 [Aspergillus leporis]